MGVAILYHPDQDINKKDGSRAYCQGCFGKLTHRQHESDDDEKLDADDKVVPPSNKMQVVLVAVFVAWMQH